MRRGITIANIIIYEENVIPAIVDAKGSESWMGIFSNKIRSGPHTMPDCDLPQTTKKPRINQSVERIARHMNMCVFRD